MNAGKVILGALTIIGLYFLSVSLGYTHLKQRKTMSIGLFSKF